MHRPAVVQSHAVAQSTVEEHSKLGGVHTLPVVQIAVLHPAAAGKSFRSLQAISMVFDCIERVISKSQVAKSKRTFPLYDGVKITVAEESLTPPEA